MPRQTASLYRGVRKDMEKRLSASIDRGCLRHNERPLIFFRADDIGVPSKNFSRMIAIFKRKKTPLCLATVPTWLTRDRLHSLLEQTESLSSQWYWHQHGYVHHNFETTGKKQEFGPSRMEDEIARSLAKGKKRLECLLEDQFNSFFTPPWNRCSEATLSSLTSQNFVGISRSLGALPPAPVGLPDFQVGVDLHTRKESDGDLAFENLLAELEKCLVEGCCGIMLHHQRMNNRAFDFLELLLSILQARNQADFVHFGHLLENSKRQLRW